LSFIKAKDGTEIFYKAWGFGGNEDNRPTVVFSHGWPLNADAWDEQMFFLASHGYRVIAHDRRGHGRSEQPWHGNNMDTYADDLAALVKALDLSSTVHVGHSTGGGEVARYIGRHGTKRVAKAVLVGAVTPIMLKSDSNPDGTPMKAFDDIREGVANNRSQFYKDLSGPFYGANRVDSRVTVGQREQFWLQGMSVGLKAAYDCVKAFSESDFTEDLKKIDVPTLFIHGDDDQIVPIKASAMVASKLVKDSALSIYKGAPHGLTATHREQFHQELLAFIKA
jgi:non-heme chloroperoxidase